MKGKRNFLLLSVLLFAISVSAEPLAHDHYEEEDHHHHDESCLIWHFVEISSIDHFNYLEISDALNKNLTKEEYSSYFLSHSSPYSTRAPPKI